MVIVFHGVAAGQLCALGEGALARLEAHFVRICADPGLGRPRSDRCPLREYTAPGVRVLFTSSALGRVVIVVYVEID